MPQFIIQDFQCLVEAKINVEGLTTLHGDSSAGKSSCLKALDAAVNNRFRMGQVRYGTEYATVKARWEKGGDILLVRRRPTGSPVMKLGEQVFTKLSRSVPPEVATFNNMDPLRVGENIYSLNFNPQFQKPILLEYSQKKVMQILSASKGLDDWTKVHAELAVQREQNRGAFKTVDTIISKTKEDISAHRRAIDKTQDLIESMKTVQGEYLGTDLRIADFLKYQEKVNTQKAINSRIQVLDKLAAEYVKYEDINNKLSKNLNLKNALETNLNLKKRIELLERLCKASAKWNELNASLENNIKFKEEVIAVNKLDRRITLLESLEKKLPALLEVNNSILTSNLLKDQLRVKETVLVKGRAVSAKVKKLKRILDLQEEVKTTTQSVDKLNLFRQSVTNRDTGQLRISAIETMIENKQCPTCGNVLQGE